MRHVRTKRLMTAEQLKCCWRADEWSVTQTKKKTTGLLEENTAEKKIGKKTRWILREELEISKGIKSKKKPAKTRRFS